MAAVICRRKESPLKVLRILSANDLGIFYQVAIVFYNSHRLLAISTNIPCIMSSNGNNRQPTNDGRFGLGTINNAELSTNLNPAVQHGPGEQGRQTEVPIFHPGYWYPRMEEDIALLEECQDYLRLKASECAYIIRSQNFSEVVMQHYFRTYGTYSVRPITILRDCPTILASAASNLRKLIASHQVSQPVPDPQLNQNNSHAAAAEASTSTYNQQRKPQRDRNERSNGNTSNADSANFAATGPPPTSNTITTDSTNANFGRDMGHESMSEDYQMDQFLQIFGSTKVFLSTVQHLNASPFWGHMQRQ
ncbi:hypothetical protein BDB00DRAFT_935570 [Zychaea mexicana]|uniref:uncharacterized protein n=1 Tax=Zychaea mexicana TaxID=64656 RepID=UPI0022FF2BD6|nr:uncharacterized protein BDB00DRAFT_935570 [Zychaea mexicana]KAI9498365.1 hypothetical protein BDB00DRAFT_935570 [Zychaea mexicana]